jgi:hypothetical protein
MYTCRIISSSIGVHLTTSGQLKQAAHMQICLVHSIFTIDVHILQKSHHSVHAATERDHITEHGQVSSCASTPSHASILQAWHSTQGHQARQPVLNLHSGKFSGNIQDYVWLRHESQNIMDFKPKGFTVVALKTAFVAHTDKSTQMPFPLTRLRCCTSSFK